MQNISVDLARIEAKVDSLRIDMQDPHRIQCSGIFYAMCADPDSLGEDRFKAVLLRARQFLRCLADARGTAMEIVVVPCDLKPCQRPKSHCKHERPAWILSGLDDFNETKDGAIAPRQGEHSPRSVSCRIRKRTGVQQCAIGGPANNGGRSCAYAVHSRDHGATRGPVDAHQEIAQCLYQDALCKINTKVIELILYPLRPQGRTSFGVRQGSYC
jgi:hypothetical protein